MRTIHRRQFLAATGAALGVATPFGNAGGPERSDVQESQAAHKRAAYALEVHPGAGIVRRLGVPTDPPGINLIHLLQAGGFGALAITRRDEESVYMVPSNFSEGPKGDVVQFREHHLYAHIIEATEDRIICQNPITKHTITYDLHDTYFDLWLEGELAFANQVALDLDVAFLDLRQTDPPEYQYTAKCPYRAEDRSLCYVYLDRVVPPGLLITALMPAAAWRLRYNGQGFVNNGPDHAVQGLQMIHRFDTGIDPEAKPGPVRFGVRVSFPNSLLEARLFIAREMGIPIITAPVLGGEVGSTHSFQIEGPAVGAEIRSPSLAVTSVPLTSIGPGRFMARVTAEEEGLYTLRTWNRNGRGGDCVIHSGMPAVETLRRATATLDPVAGQYDDPSVPMMLFAEEQYWAQAYCLARQWVGPNPGHDALIYDALVRIGMQGVKFAGLPAPPLQETHIARNFPRNGDGYLNVPLPKPHVYEGKTFSPFHLHNNDRVQDAFEWIRTYLLAWRAYENNEFYEHAVRIAEAHIIDNVDTGGRVYCLMGGLDTVDYTTVIAPLQSLAELTVEMEGRSDPRAGKIRQTCVRIADYLLRRGFEFPTEGCAPNLRWTEDGSIACTALSLLFAYHFIERNPAYLDMARRVLEYHEAWRMDVPDARMLDSTYRYWETQWENDGEGKALEGGHAWSLWRAEALYYYALATGDALPLLQSYNGFRANFCKFMPDGTAYSCFTPDFIPDRLRERKPMHSYPQRRDPSIAFYLWPRAAKTWLRTCAIVDPVDVGYSAELGPLILNGTANWSGGTLIVHPSAPFCSRLFFLTHTIKNARIENHQPFTALFVPNSYAVVTGIQSGRENQEAKGITVQSVNDRIELRQT
jgi:hypothetical protein